MKRNRKRIKSLEEEVKKLRIKIFKLEQLTCEHRVNSINHTTQGHWRGDEYVGGDIYKLYCEVCHLELDEVSNRWDVQWDEEELKKLNEWRKKYGDPT